MTNDSILICGAGIAGPTLAYWLDARGFKPSIVERAPALRTGGYVIDFWGHGYEVAERMGIIPDLKRTGYDVQALRLVDERGREVGGFGVDVMRDMTGARYTSIQRGDLARLVYRRVEGRVETVFGDTVTELRQDESGVTAVFAHAPARRFDLVIGADGQHSAVRELVFGPERRFDNYLGYMAAAFVLKGYRPRDELVYVSYGVPGRQISRFAMRDDRTVFLFVFASDRPETVHPHQSTAQKAALRAAFADVGWECPRILEALDECDELYFDRVSQIRMDTWHKGRVGLIGDAAFAPSLLAGQGSALAMTAAYVLAGELDRAQGDFARALRRYQELLGGFMRKKQAAAARFSGSFAPRTRLGLVMRNRITRAFSLPIVARLALGSLLADRIALPDYAPARTRNES